MTLNYTIRHRRQHSAEFKSRLIAICQQPGISVSVVALEHGLNANLLQQGLGRSPCDGTACGIESLRSWDATLYLHETEFHVAVLPPHVAAVEGVIGEALLPPLLALGLFGRFGALGLFVVNVVALLSYMYALQTPAIMFHFIWGILLMMVALWGPGKWSVDHVWTLMRTARTELAGRRAR